MATSITIGSTIHNGAVVRQLLLNHANPATVAVGILVVKLSHTGVVTKEFHCTQDIATIGTTAGWGVIHLLFLTDVTHQPSHSIGLGISITIQVVVNHIVPIKGDGRQRLDLEIVTVVTRNSRSGAYRIFPVIEHHCQRSGRATSDTELAIIHRAMVVVGFLLIPHGREQRSHTCDTSRLVQFVANNQLRMLLQILHLSLVIGQPVPHVGRNAFLIQRTVTIGKHLWRTVVT